MTNAGSLVTVGVGEKPVAPFILSLIAGTFILLGAIVMSTFTFGATGMMGSTSGMAGMMSGDVCRNGYDNDDGLCLSSYSPRTCLRRDCAFGFGDALQTPF